MPEHDKIGITAVREQLEALAGQMQRNEVTLDQAAAMIRNLLPNLQRNPGPMNPGRRAEMERRRADERRPPQ